MPPVPADAERAVRNIRALLARPGTVEEILTSVPAPPGGARSAAGSPTWRSDRRAARSPATLRIRSHSRCRTMLIGVVFASTNELDQADRRARASSPGTSSLLRPGACRTEPFVLPRAWRPSWLVNDLSCRPLSFLIVFAEDSLLASPHEEYSKGPGFTEEMKVRPALREGRHPGQHHALATRSVADTRRQVSIPMMLSDPAIFPSASGPSALLFLALVSAAMSSSRRQRVWCTHS